MIPLNDFPYTINDLQSLCNDETIRITQHAEYRLKERVIKYSDTKSCILSGEIIEQYASDYPFPSCLVLGKAINGQPLHTVAGIGNGFLWIVTAYYPTADEWENDYKTRKGKK